MAEQSAASVSSRAPLVHSFYTNHLSFTRFVLRTLPLRRSLSPQQCARVLVAAVERRRNYVVYPTSLAAFYEFNHFLPSVVNFLVSLGYKKTSMKGLKI